MWRASKWRQAIKDCSLYIGSGEDPARGVNSSGYGNRRPIGHDDALTIVTQSLGMGWEDMVNDQEM